MKPNTVPAAGEAVSPTQIASAFQDMENEFCVLSSMTFTLEFMLDQHLHDYRHHQRSGATHTLEIGKDALNAIAVLTSEVRNRSSDLLALYYQALDGKAVRQ